MSHSGHSAEGRGLSLHEVTRRVQKLIAVAERTTHPDESDAFSRKAAELIARYRLSAEALRLRQPDEYVMHELVLGRGAYVRARFSLLSGVADAMGCLATFLTGPSGTTAQISGPLREVEAVEVLFNSLHQQMATQVSKQRRTTSAATQRFRRAFMFGFAERVSEMLHDAHSVAAAEQEDAQSLLPIMLEQRERVHRFAAEHLGPIRAAAAPAPVVANGASAGRQAASDVDLGRIRVASQYAIGQGS